MNDDISDEAAWKKFLGDVVINTGTNTVIYILPVTGWGWHILYATAHIRTWDMKVLDGEVKFVEEHLKAKSGTMGCSVAYKQAVI